VQEVLCASANIGRLSGRHTCCRVQAPTSAFLAPMAPFASRRSGSPGSAATPGCPPGTTDPESLFKLTATGTASICSRDLFLFAFALLHYRARGYFFSALSIAARALRGLFDMFVLALLLRRCSAEMSFNCHKFACICAGFLTR